MLEALVPLAVGVIWGNTNVGMKYHSDKMRKVRIYIAWIFVQFLAFFLLNQFASILLMCGFKYTRKYSQIKLRFLGLSKGVVIANSTALLTSALTSSWIYHEKMGLCGMLISIKGLLIDFQNLSGLYSYVRELVYSTVDQNHKILY